MRTNEREAKAPAPLRRRTLTSHRRTLAPLHRVTAAVVLLLMGVAPVAAQAPQPAPAAAAAPAPRPASAPAAAQAPKPGPRPGEIEVAPIQCWWKASTTAIRIGERFTITLTCGVVETSGLTVVANTTQLDPGAVQLTPFEVVSGTRQRDIVVPQRRYFQYDYQVRLLSEGFFGQDLTIPALPVTYNIKAASGGGAQGRDQTYNLPPLPMRVISLVPKDANDIRDANTEGFAPIEARRARATAASVAGGVLLAFAGVLLVVGILRAMGRVRGRQPAADRPLAPVTALGGSLRAIGRTKADALREGWSPALARRALAPLRVAAAVALGRPVAKAMVQRDNPEREGQLIISEGLLRPRRLVISAATTVHGIDRALEDRYAYSPGARALIERLRAAMQVLAAAGYGRSPEIDAVALDNAVTETMDAMRQLRRRHVWPMGRSNGARATAARVRVPSLSEERL